ncbi:MAG: sulfurtransferase [Gemmatimonadota bacterium]
MKHLTAIFTTALFASPLAAQAPMVVSADWLHQNLNQPGLVLLQIGDDRSRPVYDEGHIAGSQFLNPFQKLSTPRVEGQLILELPEAAIIATNLEAMGISNSSRVILIMANEYLTPTTRTYFTMVYAGLEGQVSVLDGGLEAWKAAGFPVTVEVAAVTPGEFTPKLKPSVVTDAEYVARHLKDAKARIVDARTPNFYQGAETRQGRNGHIAGAVNVPFGTIVGDRMFFKSPGELRKLFMDAGVTDGQKVVTYCHIGQQASAAWFAAKLAGFDAALYDGSFQNWAARTELPVVTPTAPPER